MRRDRLWSILGQAESQGCRIDATRSQHIRIRLPDGQTQFFTGSTPSDVRSTANLAATLRRSGLDIR